MSKLNAQDLAHVTGTATTAPASSTYSQMAPNTWLNRQAAIGSWTLSQAMSQKLVLRIGATVRQCLQQFDQSKFWESNAPVDGRDRDDDSRIDFLNRIARDGRHRAFDLLCVHRKVYRQAAPIVAEQATWSTAQCL